MEISPKVTKIQVQGKKDKIQRVIMSKLRYRQLLQYFYLVQAKFPMRQDSYKKEPGPRQMTKSDPKEEKVDFHPILERKHHYDQTQKSLEKLKRCYHFPADYYEAKMHKKSRSFGHKYRKIDDKVVPQCPCCENVPSTMKIPLCYQTSPKEPKEGELKFVLETTTVLYFSFIKTVIMYLLLRLLIVDAATILLSSNGSFCSNLVVAKSSYLCVYTISGYNLKSSIDQPFLNTLDILNLVFTICSMVLFIILRKHRFAEAQWLDFNQITEDDFTVLVQNIPKLIYCSEQRELSSQKNEFSSSKREFSSQMRELSSQNELDHQFQYKSQLYTIINELIKKWLEKMISNTNYEQHQSQIEKDFEKFVLKSEQFKKQQSGEEKYKQHPIFQEPIVTSIALCYDISQIENLEEYRQEKIQQYLALKAQMEKVEDDNQDKEKKNLLKRIYGQIDTINEQIVRFCQTFVTQKTGGFLLSNFTGKAFVSLQYQHYRNYLVEQSYKNKNFCKIGRKNLSISRASPPETIIWENMKVKHSYRVLNMIKSSGILLALLAASFSLIIFLDYFKFYKNQNSLVLSMLMAIAVTGINLIVGRIVEYLSDMQKLKTTQDRSTSHILKILIAESINTVFIYMFLYLIKHINPLSSNGLVSHVYGLLTTSALFSLGFSLLMMPYQALKKWYYERKYSQEEQINLFQIQLNQKIEKPVFSIEQGCSFYIVFTFAVSFYGFLVPFGAAIIIPIFVLSYWIDKYNLFRKSSEPTPFNLTHIKIIVKFFEINVILSSFGYLIWQPSVHFDNATVYQIINWVNLLISILFVLLSFFSMMLPPEMKKKLFRQEEFYIERQRYSQYWKQNAFKYQYSRQNPATLCFEEKIKDRKQPPACVQYIQKNQYQTYLSMDDSLKVRQKCEAEDVEIYRNIHKGTIQNTFLKRNNQKSRKNLSG